MERGDLKNSLIDLLRLTRWSNLLFLGALVWLMEKWVAAPVLVQAAFGEQLPGYIVVLMALAIIFIAAGGYVINDYFDIKIDRINRPDAVIFDFSELKELFPKAPHVAWDKVRRV